MVSNRDNVLNDKGDLSNILCPTCEAKVKRKKDNLTSSGGYIKKRSMKNIFVFERCELIDSTSEGNKIGVVWK